MRVKPQIAQALFLLAGFVVGCGGPVEETSEPPDLEAVVEETEKYQGRQVTIQAKVAEVYSDCAMLLSDTDWGVAERALTVCSTLPPNEDEAPAAPQAGDWVRVTGTPMEMTRVGYEQRAAATVDEDVFGKRETMTTVIADKIELIADPPERL